MTPRATVFSRPMLSCLVHPILPPSLRPSGIQRSTFSGNGVLVRGAAFGTLRTLFGREPSWYLFWHRRGPGWNSVSPGPLAQIHICGRQDGGSPISYLTTLSDVHILSASGVAVRAARLQYLHIYYYSAEKPVRLPPAFLFPRGIFFVSFAPEAHLRPHIHFANLPQAATLTAMSSGIGRTFSSVCKRCLFITTVLYVDTEFFMQDGRSDNSQPQLMHPEKWLAAASPDLVLRLPWVACLLNAHAVRLGANCSQDEAPEVFPDSEALEQSTAPHHARIAKFTSNSILADEHQGYMLPRNVIFLPLGTCPQDDEKAGEE
ncbi:hypothetical protein C8J57DRAFT_1237792 [Mycena rebaudengoi]|nr:hypothetical protein C8J57DRAFT_1237792 [Mycena rebaudengoi]